MLIRREIQPLIEEQAKFYPVIAIMGPRQSGKTTLSKMIFPKKPYVNLEDPSERAFFENDPKGFLNRYPKGAIIDEAQNCPDLFSYIQVLVDEEKIPGMFILTGSQNFLVLEKISQSLAGRICLFNLLPFSFTELLGSEYFDDSKDRDALILNGAYPPIYDKQLCPKTWYANYIQSYIEKDIKTILNIKNQTAFKKFLSLCASNVGQIFNVSKISASIGVDHRTISSWMSILEASFIIKLVYPYYKNFKKRIIKSPKIYFYDTGIACHLLKINTTKTLLDDRKQFGHLFENFIITEIMKLNNNYNRNWELYFWRDSHNNEVDLLIEKDRGLLPIEIKSSETFQPKFAEQLNHWHRVSTMKGNSFVIYRGKDIVNVENNKFLPWQAALSEELLMKENSKK